VIKAPLLFAANAERWEKCGDLSGLREGSVPTAVSAKPEKSLKQRQPAEKGTDAAQQRLPGSFESGKANMT
jgi:hypothetical protein